MLGRLQPASGRRYGRNYDPADVLVLLGEKLGRCRLGAQPLYPTGYRVDGHHTGDQKRVNIAADDRGRGCPDSQDRSQRVGELGPRRGQQRPPLARRVSQRPYKRVEGKVVENLSPGRVTRLNSKGSRTAGQPE